MTPRREVEQADAVEERSEAVDLAPLPERHENGQQPSALSLIQMALEKSENVEVIERIVALQERMNERSARAAFFHALAAFQEVVPEIPKSRTAQIATKSGARYSYTYAPLEAITRAIRPALKEHGLYYSWDVEAGDGMLTVVCVLRHIEGHEERARFPVPTATKTDMTEAQKNGAALTYGRRQSLIAVLGLTAADDTDGAEPEDDEKITESQAADLSALADDVGADRARFLKYMGVESFQEIRASDHQKAVRALESKRKGAQ